MTSWRISQDKEVLVGTGDSKEQVDKCLTQMVGLKFVKINIISKCLDIEVLFENKFKITTFCSGLSEFHQWNIDLPNGGYFCSMAESINQLQKVYEDAESLKLINRFKQTYPLEEDFYISNIQCDEDGFLVIYGKKNLIINCVNKTWRLEKDHEYLFGRLDILFNEFYEKNNIQILNGKKLLKFEVDASLKDARISFEGGYVLTFFTSSQQGGSLEILKKFQSIYSIKSLK